MLAVYVSSLIRCVIALHNLIDNKEMRHGKKPIEKPKLAVEGEKADVKADESKENTTGSDKQENGTTK